jgi:hypothetical protein
MAHHEQHPEAPNLNTTMYPRNLAYAVSKMSGYHRNTFRIESTTAQTASAGRIITVNLPENAVIDLHSFRWVINDAVTSFTQDTSIAAGSAPWWVKAYLPQGNLLISRLEVLVNGVQITQGMTEYNTAFKLLQNARINTTKQQSINYALQNGNFGAATSTTATFNSTTVGQDIQMIISDWLGFLEAPSTRFIDTGLLGMITIRITLADNNVLSPAYCTGAVGATVPATASFDPTVGPPPTTTTGVIGAQGNVTQSGVAQLMTYSLNNFYFTIDAISINDGAYDALVRAKLSREGFLSINFDEYYSFMQDSNTANNVNVRFAVSSQSINKIYGTIRNTQYTSRGIPATAAISGAFNTEAFFPSFFRFKSYANDNNLKWNFSINNVYHPQYLASELEGLNQLIMCENKAGFDKDKLGNLISTFGEYRNNKFMVGIRLNHPIDGEVRNAFTSGFDSRGTNAQLLWQVQNINGLSETINANAASAVTYNCYILVNTTNTLRVGLGRSVELIA